MNPLVRDKYGVNQGGNVSPVLFRQYMANLGAYLTKRYGLCIADDISVQLLWSDDLVLISDSENGLKNQMNGLLNFCASNYIIINESKPKAIVPSIYSYIVYQ